MSGEDASRGDNENVKEGCVLATELCLTETTARLSSW